MTLPSQFRGHRFHSLSGNQVPYATTKTWSGQIKKGIFYTSHAVFGTFSGFLILTWASLVAQLVKESTCNVGDLSLVPELGRSPGEGKGYPLRYSGLENSMGCIVHGVANSPTLLSDFHFHFQHNSKVSILQHSAFFMVLLSQLYMTTGKIIALARWTFVGKVNILGKQSYDVFILLF